MENYEFDSGMKRLTDVYSEKAYPPERRKLIYYQMKNLNREEWHNLVSRMIMYQRYAPMMDDFVEAASLLKREASPDRIGNCDLCSGYGSLMAIREGLKYAFKCTCEAGEILVPKFTVWSSRFKEAGFSLV